MLLYAAQAHDSDGQSGEEELGKKIPGGTTAEPWFVSDLRSIAGDKSELASFVLIFGQNYP